MVIQNIEFVQHKLALHKPFVISQGTKTHVEVFYVKVSDAVDFGIGSCLSATYVTGETVADTRAALDKLAIILQGEPLAWPRLAAIIQTHCQKTPAAAAAVEIAIFDLIGIDIISSHSLFVKFLKPLPSDPKTSTHFFGRSNNLFS